MILTREQVKKIQEYLDKDTKLGLADNARAIEFMLKLLEVPHTLDYATHKITFWNME